METTFLISFEFIPVSPAVGVISDKNDDRILDYWMIIAVVVCLDNTNDWPLDSRIISPKFLSTVKDCAVFSTNYSSSSESTGAKISRLLILLVPLHASLCLSQLVCKIIRPVTMLSPLALSQVLLMRAFKCV